MEVNPFCLGFAFGILINILVFCRVKSAKEYLFLWLKLLTITLMGLTFAWFFARAI